MNTVTFLGGGRITSAILAGLQLKKNNYRLVVHDRNPEKLRRLAKSHRITAENDLQRAIALADLLIVAVRPDSWRALLRDIGNVPHQLLAVSLIAGVPLRALSKASDSRLQWVCAMPSPVCRMGYGLTALTFSRSVSRASRVRIRKLFGTIGRVIEIPEAKFDAFTVTYSSSHAYHALSTLAAAAQEIGLDRETALLASAHALADGIAAWREGALSLDSLLEEASTPGGIAAATMAGMNAAGYGRAVRKGLRAGLQKARANAKK